MPSILCYPPAESKIPLKAFLQSAASGAVDIEQSLGKATGSVYCLFGPNVRALLFNLCKILYVRSGRRRNEVLIPGYTCYSVPAAIVKAGLKVRFYDIDPATLNPDHQSLEFNCGEHTLAVISQHLFGIPMDLEVFGKIGMGEGVYHIEDAAQAYGSRHYGKALGTTGDFGLFSFGRGKSLPLGGGGALTSQHHNLAEMMPPIRTTIQWRSLLINLITQIASQPFIYGLSEMLPLGLGETIFDPGFKAGNISLFQKNLLKPMMAYFPELNRHRNAIASIYRNSIDADCLISEPAGSEPIYPRFPVVAKEGPLPAQLWRLGIRRLYPKALNMEASIAAHATNPGQKLPGAEALAQQLVTLPTHHSINGRVAEIIARKLNQWIGQ